MYTYAMPVYYAFTVRAGRLFGTTDGYRIRPLQ